VSRKSGNLDETSEEIIDNRGNFIEDSEIPSTSEQRPIASEVSPSTRLVSKTKEYQEEGNFFIRFQKKHPFLTVLIASVILIIIILAIVLPATLVKKKEEKLVGPRCPDGINQPRIDCLPDRKILMESGANMEATCKKRACCWSASVDLGGPNCAFPTNYGFRNLKTKESTFSSQWLELARLNVANSYAKSDISNLETRVEMHTDSRLRIRVISW
jgi:hypothetical protein